MFESIMNLFKKLNKKEKKATINSKEAAKERLHLVLMQDRANVSADFLELMKQEIIDVIKKYIDVDEGAIDVRLTNKENEDGTNGAPALYANIPILNIKNDSRKIGKKEIETKKENEEKAEDKKLWIFLCGVTDPAGNEYTTITPSADMYIQLGDDWTKEDIRATFISDAIDEPVESIEYLDNFEGSPAEDGEFSKLTLKHFSPYAVYDELTDEEKKMMEKLLNGELTEDELNDMISEANLNEPTTPDDNNSDNFEYSEPSISYITGDQRGYVITIAVIALIIAGITILVSLKNKKNK